MAEGGIEISYSVPGAAALADRLRPARLHFALRGLMEALARLGALQTVKRIETEKTSPDGAPWAPTRDGRPALFVTGEHLARSIDHASSATQAIWGSGWIGARVHQFGATIKPVNGKVLRFMIGGREAFARSVTIPARPYLGVSAENRIEIEAVAQKVLAAELGA